ncbi:MAG: deoxyribose-phosphate aldolase [bacterium]
MNKVDLAHMIDYTLLKPDATTAEIERVCREAIELGVYAVCFNPIHIATAKRSLASHDVKVCTVAGFPLGASVTAVKAFETLDSVNKGADEIDIVMNIGAFKDGSFSDVQMDVAAVVKAAREKVLIKVILETNLLTDDEIRHACILCRDAGASFVKTATGITSGGALTRHVEIMRSAVGYDMGVKAAGGIRDYDTAVAMVNAGANRIGTSSAVNILS